MRGLDIYTTKDGFKVAKLHYTADPNRDPDRNGAKWLENALKGVPGGKTGASWRKEQEIDFTAYSGQLLCYHILQQFRYKIVRDKFVKAIDHKYGSVDWGRNNPASFHTYAVDEEGLIYSCYEVYQRDISIPDFCSLIKESPHYQDLLWIAADSSMWNKNQEDKEGLKSLEDKFQENGITLQKGRSKDDTFAINELLERWYKLDTQEPKFIISPKCSKQIWELERLRYKEITTAMIEQKNPSETLIDKDNHAWDDWKYFISTFLSPPDMNREEVLNPNSIWGRHMLELKKKDDFVYGH